jgi:hypothetical protein
VELDTYYKLQRYGGCLWAVRLGYKGVPSTFEKKIIGGSYCRVQLYRALGSAEWCTRFPQAEVRHLADFATSDHLPILLQMVPRRNTQRRGKKLFRYEPMWETHEAFLEMIKQMWSASDRSSTMLDLQPS